MAKGHEFGLFVKGAEDNPVLTGNDPALLGRVRLAEYARYATADSVVAPAKSKPEDLFPEEPEVANVSAIQAREAQLRQELTQEKIDEQLKAKIESEASEAADAAITQLEEAEDAAEAAEEVPVEEEPAPVG